jgi:hypothetical protein
MRRLIVNFYGEPDVPLFSHDGYTPRNSACSVEPMPRPDLRAKKHPRPADRRKKVRWSREREVV